jgi:outer membrane biogenesis lipoprotein LolB
MPGVMRRTGGRIAAFPRVRTVVMKRHGVVAVLLLSGCPGSKYPKPGEMTAKDVVAKLDAARAARTSFKVQTTMDYWLGKQRAKGTVLVMGTSKRQVRFNAIKPDDTVLIDMACNGTDFTYVNFQDNCQLAGPCNKSSIGSLLHVDLEPDDFHHLAQGTPPTIPNATGTVAWDDKKGYWRVELTGDTGTQKLVIDGRKNHFDVLSATLTDKNGKTVWSVENTDFREIADVNKVKHRVPGKTSFKSPQQQADLLVEWKDDQREINLDLSQPPTRFTVNIPAGLPSCGSKP